MPLSISAIPRASTLVESVSEKLALAIRGERLVGDGWLPPERLLAEQLGVSRTVVREATKRLELQGLVEVQHGIGIKVVDRLHAPITGSLTLLIPDQVERLRQSLEVRIAIEPEIARLAASRASARSIQELRRIHEQLESATELSDAVEADIAFHRALARASGNDIFTLLLETISEVGRESREATISYAGVERARKHHEAIMIAIEIREPVSAANAMRLHIESAVEDLRGRLQQTHA